MGSKSWFNINRSLTKNYLVNPFKGYNFVVTKKEKIMKPYGAKQNYNELDDFNRSKSRDGGIKNSKAPATKKRCNKTLKTRVRRDNKIV